MTVRSAIAVISVHRTAEFTIGGGHVEYETIRVSTASRGDTVLHQTSWVT